MDVLGKCSIISIFSDHLPPPKDITNQSLYWKTQCQHRTDGSTLLEKFY